MAFPTDIGLATDELGLEVAHALALGEAVHLEDQRVGAISSSPGT
jgi:hypothetical protein